MTPTLRLALVVGIILGSGAYLGLVIINRDLAMAIVMGYIAIVVSLFLIVYLGRKP